MPDARSKQEHAERAADVLVENLRTTLDAPELHKRRIDIVLDSARNQSYVEEEGAERALHFVVADDLGLDGRLWVRNFGGNVYLVRVKLEGGEGLRWQLSLPELEAPQDTLRKHTGDFSRRVLLELERIYGERAMQSRKSSEAAKEGEWVGTSASA